MGQYDYLVPGATATQPKATGGQFDSLIPKQAPVTTPQPSIASKALALVKGIAEPVAAATLPAILPSFSGFASAIKSVPAFVSSEVQGAAKGFNETPNAPKTPLTPASVGQATIDAGTNAFQQGVANVSDHFGTIANHNTSLLQKGVATGQAAIGAVNATFGIALAPLQGLASVPGLGSVVDGLNKIFGAISEGSGAGAVHVLNQLPLSDQTKQTLTPLVHDAAGLAAQLVIGKMGSDFASTAVAKISDHSKTILTELSNDPAIRDAIAKHAQPEPTPPPVLSPAEKQAAYAKTQGYEPYVSSDKLPVIDMGSKPKSSLPTIQADAPTVRKVPGDLTIEPLDTTASTPPTSSDEAASKASSETPTVPLPRPLSPEPGISKIGKSIEAKAVEDNLTQGFKDTAGYDPITIKEQATKATELVTTNIDTARSIVRGEQPLPDGLRGTALITAMEEHIKANPDGELAYELANSPLVSATSAAAQEMRLMAERVPDSLTAQFKAIKTAREAAVEKRGGLQKASKAITDSIRKAIKANASKRPSWEEFINEVQCAY